MKSSTYINKSERTDQSVKYSNETNRRVQEIKKKYGTPSNRSKLDSTFKPTRASQEPDPLRNSYGSRPRDSIDNYVGHPNTNDSTLAKRGNATNNDLNLDSQVPLKQSHHISREEEEAFFRKMKAIKDSFTKQSGVLRESHDYLQRQNQTTKQNANKSMSFQEVYQSRQKSKYKEQKYERSIDGYRNIESKQNIRQKNNNRVQNIDKINLKIKHILQCLNEQQKYYGRNKIQKQTQNKSSARFGLKDNNQAKKQIQLKQKHKYRNSEDLQIYQEKNNSKNYIDSNLDGTDNKLTNEYFLNNKNLLSYRMNLQSPIKNTFTPKQNQIKIWNKKSQFNNKLQDKSSKSKSYIASIKQQHHRQNATLQKSRSKFDDEIEKIQRKITFFENEKRKLGVQFTPFKYSKTRSTSQLGKYKGIQRFNDKIQSNQFRNRQDSRLNQDKTKTQNIDYSFQQLTKNKNKQFNINQDLENKQKNLEINKLKNLENNKQKDLKNKTIQIQNDKQLCKKTNCKNQYHYLNENLRKNTNQGIQERKKKLNIKDQKSNFNIKKLVSALCQIVKYDEELRNQKLWLQLNGGAHSKSTEINLQLQKRGIKLQKQQIIKTFSVTQQENNPFFSTQNYSGSINSLIDSYTAGEKYWNQNIKGQFKGQLLKNEGFNESKIDLQKKKFIQVQDLVRFLNIESGTFFRNRDLILVFRRITKSDKVEFNYLLDIFQS